MLKLAKYAVYCSGMILERIKQKVTMYNYFNPVSGSDRFGLQRHDEQRVQALCDKLKFPIEDILKAVQEVGFDKDEVEEYIRDRYNRSL